MFLKFSRKDTKCFDIKKFMLHNTRFGLKDFVKRQNVSIFTTRYEKADISVVKTTKHKTSDDQLS